MHVAVRCPDCGYTKVVSGRGRCRCGAYLLHHMARTFIASGKGRVWDVSRDPPRLIHDDEKDRFGGPRRV